MRRLLICSTISEIVNSNVPGMTNIRSSFDEPFSQKEGRTNLENVTSRNKVLAFLRGRHPRATTENDLTRRWASHFDFRSFI
jgi:hypothetical protein